MHLVIWIAVFALASIAIGVIHWMLKSSGIRKGETKDVR